MEAPQSQSITQKPPVQQQRGVNALPQGKQVGSAIPVSEDCSMTIVADGIVTQEGLERLKLYIDLIKTWFPAQRPTQ